MERWCGRVALVTGASGGIGAAICKALVVAGLKVVGVDRDLDHMLTLTKDLANESGMLTPIKCDLTEEDEVLSMFATIKEKYGGVDVCVNSAGMSRNSSLLDGTPEEWREMLNLNVVALCLCTREAVASMREREVDDGHVIQISSYAGYLVHPNAALHFYSATKFAVTALIEGLRQELASSKSHIRVTGIMPGIVETDFTVKMTQDPEYCKRLYASFKCLQAEDIAASVIHALSAPPHVQVDKIIIRATEGVR
ncbi:dehydrogenase/reductase SDR family member 11-like isoform X2 [Oratosquilla oratoria]